MGEESMGSMGCSDSSSTQPQFANHSLHPWQPQEIHIIRMDQHHCLVSLLNGRLGGNCCPWHALSCPTFVAGIIKYAERTWVLKLVSNDKLGNIVPFDNVSNTIEEENYECALLMAQKLVKQFKCYMENYDTSAFGFPIGPGYMNSVWDIETHFWDAIEVEMGLMYDLLYTKAAKTFTTGGCILRFISFACTVSVLIGFFCFIFGGGRWHEHYSMIDIAITGVLLVGALALEIYAVAILLSSDWTMLWLIKLNKSKWVIQLGEKFPWFFPMLKKKRWSKMMGQFDLIGFCLKKDESRLSKLSSRILGLLGIEEKVERIYSTYDGRRHAEKAGGGEMGNAEIHVVEDVMLCSN
ncbi:hypothetical protein Acr_29g0009950 [Actinidia rufa]|uniref:DUF4220 domain-containing protein n=1 Tax=Actinidia rufa TaxID=165716 RepID=A0A7J0HFF3_9ERIC|nr:hypothetical protein Acr_29g0009950 [Actinidia rufa]